MSLDDLQAQLRGALDQQFAALKQQYDDAVAAAREQARADAEQQASARIASARTEIEAQMSAIISATRAEAFQQAELKARAERQALEKELEQQLEQTVQHAVNSVKRTSEMELDSLRRRIEQDVLAERQRGEAALDAERGRTQSVIDQERQRGQAALETERARAQSLIEDERTRLQQALDEQASRAAEELEAVKQLLETEITSAQAEAAAAREDADAARAQVDAARQETETARQEMASVRQEAADAAATTANVPASPAALARVPAAIRGLDTSASLSQMLESLLQHAGAIAGRAALFLINGDRLKSWKTVAIPEIDVQTVESSITGRDLLARAIQAGQTTSASDALPAPPFARLTGEHAVAVPLLVLERPVAVLYADAGGSAPSDGWTEAIDLIARHASTLAGLRAATRTLDVLRGDAAGSATPGNGDGEAARRYARLLVSEIKLYNETAVREGRQRRDLRQRLRTDIDRALSLYQERVPATVADRDAFFQTELVTTLADGDPALLGN